MESVDNDNEAWNIVMTEKNDFLPKPFQVLNEKVIAVEAEATVLKPSIDGGSVLPEKKTITAIPYYTWANRGPSQMQVWLPTTIKDVKINY